MKPRNIYCPNCDDDTLDQGKCYLCDYENPIINDDLGSMPLPQLKPLTPERAKELNAMFAEFCASLQYKLLIDGEVSIPIQHSSIGKPQ